MMTLVLTLCFYIAEGANKVCDIPDVLFTMTRGSEPEPPRRSQGIREQTGDSKPASTTLKGLESNKDKKQCYSERVSYGVVGAARRHK